MSNRGVDQAKALYEQDESDCDVRDRLVEEGLSVRSASTAMWRARRLLKRRPDGSIKTGSTQMKGGDWHYLEKIVLPAEAAFLAALRATERPPLNLVFGEQSVPLRIGAFVT
jgi:hypothetical protein